MKYIIVIGFVCWSLTSYGQTWHEWAKSITSQPSQNNTAFNELEDIGLDSFDNSYVVGTYGDSLSIDSTGVGSFGRNVSAYVAKFNAKGDAIWLKRIFVPQGQHQMQNQSLRLTDVAVVNSNRIVAAGLYAIGSQGPRVFKFSDNDSLVLGSNSTQTFFMVEYDSLGNVVYFQKTYEGFSFDINFIRNGRMAIDDNKNLIFVFQGRNGTIHTRSGSSSFTAEPSIVKYSPHFDSIVWIGYPMRNVTSSSSFFVQRVRTDKHGYIYTLYAIGNGTYALQSTYQVNITNSGKGLLSKTVLSIHAPNGDLKHFDLIHQNPRVCDKVEDILPLDTNNIYLTGYFMDSIKINGVYYSNPITQGSDLQIPTTQDEGYPFVTKMSLRTVDWIRMPAKKSSLRGNWSHLYFSQLVIKTDFKGNIYTNIFYGHNYDISIGGLRDSLAGINGTHLFLKLDTLGNALWIDEKPIIKAMAPNSGRQLVYGGVYQRSIVIDPWELSSPNWFASSYVAQTSEYNIVRGEVSNGPYCAGDTILVPYKALGVFQSDNEFFAELSDASGNFNGGEFELGRIKATTDSVIIGSLPLFEVRSSGSYRIRVRSTHPAVQSIFRLDTLRLLIYSRDKADPGGSETICRGDSIILNMFGGTA